MALPSISTGAYGYPVAAGRAVALGAVSEVLRAGSGVRLVRFVLFSEDDLATYKTALEALPD